MPFTLFWYQLAPLYLSLRIASGGQATAGEFPAGAHAAADAGEGAALRGISAQPACPRPRLQATGRPALRREPHPRTRQPARQRRPRGRLLHFSSLAPVKLRCYVPYVITLLQGYKCKIFLLSHCSSFYADALKLVL